MFIFSSLCNLTCYSDPVPITLTSEGSFVLTNIKKISVSSDFLSLPQHNTKCQADQLKADCVTEKYQEAILELCKCAPVSLRHSYPQHVIHNDGKFDIDYDIYLYLTKQIILDFCDIRPFHCHIRFDI